MTDTPSKLRVLWDDHSYGGKALSEEELATIVAAASEIERLRVALLEAVEWNWLDDDVPEDVYEKVHKIIRDFSSAKSAE